MRPNIKQYESLIRKAKNQKVDFLKQSKSLTLTNQADIIVFSEDGLTGFEFLYSEYFLPFTQYLPDTAIGWNACQNKGSFEIFYSIHKSCNKCVGRERDHNLIIFPLRFTAQLVNLFYKGHFGVRSVVVELLSCLALDSQIYLAVNLAREIQEGGASQHYNTDIVFNRLH